MRKVNITRRQLAAVPIAAVAASVKAGRTAEPDRDPEPEIRPTLPMTEAQVVSLASNTRS